MIIKTNNIQPKAPEAMETNFDHVADARAILSGTPFPSTSRLKKWSGYDNVAQVLKEIVADAPQVTLADLANLFPDQTSTRERDDAEDIARYNALSPIQRALSEAIIDTIDNDVAGDDVVNPILRHELRLAQRRTLEKLLAMHAQSLDVPTPTETPLTKGPNISAAEILLEGKPVPAGHKWAGAYEELNATEPQVTVAQLRELYPDSDPHDDKKYRDYYDALSPVERAIEDVLYDLNNGVDEDDMRNPIYVYELRQAQRRTLERLLTLDDHDASAEPALPRPTNGASPQELEESADSIGRIPVPYEPDSVRIARAFISGDGTHRFEIVSPRMRQCVEGFDHHEDYFRCCMETERSLDKVAMFSDVTLWGPWNDRLSSDDPEDVAFKLRAVHNAMDEIFEFLRFTCEAVPGTAGPTFDFENLNLYNAVVRAAFTEMQALLNDWDTLVAQL